MIQIIEILTRATQGVTKPFLCKAEDEQLYYVKGMGSHAGHRSLLAEWIAGNLAQAFGLPIAPFKIVEISSALIDVGPSEWASLGSGAAFGSQLLEFTQELQWSQLDLIPKNLQQDILVFDWWLHNGDRSLTAKGGNPNLLWETQQQKLAVIDHNNAFDKQFSSVDFLKNHVFRAQIPVVFEDFVTRFMYLERLETAFAAFEIACHNSPPEWWWIDHDVPCSFNKEAARQLLTRFENNSFWEIAS